MAAPSLLLRRWRGNAFESPPVASSTRTTSCTTAIALFDYDPKSGMPIEQQTAFALPEIFSGASYRADLKITPMAASRTAPNRMRAVLSGRTHGHALAVGDHQDSATSSGGGAPRA